MDQVNYLRGHGPFLPREFKGFRVVASGKTPDACPDCGYSPMCYNGSRYDNYAHLTCNRPGCKTKIVVYCDPADEQAFTRVRLHQPAFGRQLPHTHIVHTTTHPSGADKPITMWHIPLYIIRPDGRYGGGQSMEVYLDDQGEVYLPTEKNKTPITMDEWRKDVK